MRAHPTIGALLAALLVLSPAAALSFFEPQATGGAAEGTFAFGATDAADSLSGYAKYLPQMSADLSNGIAGVQSSFAAASGGNLERLRRFQQSLASRFVDNEELMLRLYEMALDPERMCRNMVLESQRQLNKAQESAQANYSVANQQLNNLMAAASNQVNSAMNTTPNEMANRVLQSPALGQANQQVSSVLSKFGWGK